MLQRCYKLRSSRLTEIFWECGLFVNPGTYAFSRGNEVICWTATLNNRSLGGREPNRTSSSHFDSHKTQCCVRPISSYLSNVQLSNSQQSRSVCRVHEIFNHGRRHPSHITYYLPLQHQQEEAP